MWQMSKFDPTQETWAIEEHDNPEDGCLLVICAPGGTQLALFSAEMAEDEDEDIARARLASAAPDMARVLLELVDWDMRGDGRCFYCGLGVPGEGPEKHKPDCALDAALRKAGCR